MRILLSAVFCAASSLAFAQTVPVPNMVLATQPGRPKAPPPLACADEPYPQEAITAGATGKSIVTFSLDAEGYLEHTLVLQSAGQSREHKLLDAAAARSLWACRFSRPARPGTLIEATYVWKSPAHDAVGAAK